MRTDKIVYGKEETNGKPKIAFDIDGVLANLIPTFLMYCNERFRTKLKEEDVFTHDFCSLFGIRKEEESEMLYYFYKSRYFNEIFPMPNSQEVVCDLSEKCELGVITARPLLMENETISWVGRYFPNVFSRINFAERNSTNGNSKADVCIANNYRILVEDEPRFANQCARQGIDVFLINHPWNWETLHPKVTRVRNWQEVLQQLT